MAKLRKVEIEWRDSFQRYGWADIDEYHKEGAPSTCHSVGYLVRKDKNSVVLVMSLSDNGNACASMTIPREAVVRMRYLKGGL